MVKTPSRIPNQLHSLTWSKHHPGSQTSYTVRQHHPGSQTSYTVWHESETITASVLKLLCFVLINSILWNLSQTPSGIQRWNWHDLNTEISSHCQEPAESQSPHPSCWTVHLRRAAPILTHWFPALDALQRSDKGSSPGKRLDWTHLHQRQPDREALGDISSLSVH